MDDLQKDQQFLSHKEYFLSTCYTEYAPQHCAVLPMAFIKNSEYDMESLLILFLVFEFAMTKCVAPIEEEPGTDLW